MEKQKMICPECGAEMNHHAMKVAYEGAEIDPDFGAALEEIHTCPHCGFIAARPV